MQNVVTPWLQRRRTVARPGAGRRLSEPSAGQPARDGWDRRFEARVARIAADFVDRFDAPPRSRLDRRWIAEWPGLRMGCVFVLGARDDASGMPVACVAQPRMLLPEPAARGRGMGKLLVSELSG